jgi:hypothetical protein
MKYNLLKLFAVSTAFMNPAFAAFHEDSTVSTEEGPVQISKLRLGQKVHAYSPITTAMGKANIIYKGLSHNLTRSCIDIDIGTRIIKAMPDQRFYDLSSNMWVKARDLEAEDHVLMGQDGSPIDILDVQLRKRRVIRFPIELSVNSPGRALFIDGVLCHNMDVDTVEKGIDFLAKEGVKKSLPVEVTGPEWVGISAMMDMGVKAYKGVQESNAAIERGELIPVDINPSWGELNGFEKPAESRPAAAPRSADEIAAQRRANQEKLERFRQANRANKKHVTTVNPVVSGNQQAPVQIPSYAHPEEISYANHDWVKEPVVKMGYFEMRQKGYETPAEKAAAKRAADKEQMEGRAAAIKAAGAKTEEERRAAIKSYDDWSASLAAAPAPVLPKATPQEKEAISKVFDAQDQKATAQEPANLAPALNFAAQYSKVHAPVADNIPAHGFNRAPEPQHMESVNKAIANVRGSILPDLLRMPPSVAVSFMARAQGRADESRRSQIQANYEEEVRRIEAQAHYGQIKSAESSQKSESAVKNRRQRFQNGESITGLREQLLGKLKK